MPHDPTDIRGREHHLPRPHVIDGAHGQRQRNGVAAGVTLNAFGFSGGTGGVEQIAGFVRFAPHHCNVRVDERLTDLGIVEIATFRHRHVGVQASMHDQNSRRRKLRFCKRGINQRFVTNHLARPHPGIGADQQAGSGVVDSQGEVVRRKAAEHDGVDRTDPCASQHRNDGFAGVRHVDDDPIPLYHAEALQCGCKGVDGLIQLAIGPLVRGIGFGRYRDQRSLIATRREMTIHRVVAEVGAPTDKPLPKRRIGRIQDLLWRRFPIDRLRRVCPKSVRIIYGTAVLGCVGHMALPEATRLAR
ncbi:MAG: hypothetical protein BWZ07_02305 [Alphaproteobacteria bacterium ADurb.BinA280]|nr:MAG: hypothetical protein BWZ07_02305 [Alphaproteobacteria bacterium ADurb.BinA280]